MAKRADNSPSVPVPPRTKLMRRRPLPTLASIRVQGYKSIVDAELIIRPLTVLAGANSSGKSSMMQPLLLIKQTMEASYQTGGALLLNGPHTNLTHASQILTKLSGAAQNFFSLAIETKDRPQVNATTDSVQLIYGEANAGFSIKSLKTEAENGVVLLTTNSTWENIAALFSERTQKVFELSSDEIRVQPNGCMLRVVGYVSEGVEIAVLEPAHEAQKVIAGIMHIPGLRGNPQREYDKATLVSSTVKGTFEPYTAGLIKQWQDTDATDSINALTEALISLGLTRFVNARTINANQIEIQVDRLPATARTKAKKDDMVNIADVGFGVSQVLPIVVALIAAEPGQLVYIEQPELHLHPRAQVAMAKLLAKAAKRGVRVVVETHSSLLLLTIQTLVAEKELTPDEVALHWFARDAKGETKVTLADLDEKGTYGPWPEDFGDVELAAQSAYLNAVTRQNPFMSPQ